MGEDVLNLPPAKPEREPAAPSAGTGKLPVYLKAELMPWHGSGLRPFSTMNWFYQWRGFKGPVIVGSFCVIVAGRIVESGKRNWPSHKLANLDFPESAIAGRMGYIPRR